MCDSEREVVMDGLGNSSASSESLSMQLEPHEKTEGQEKIGEEKTIANPVSNVLRQVLSRHSAVISTQDYGPPPDGGTKAWLQVVQGHLCIVNTMGFVTSYGLFVAYYISPSSPFPTYPSSTWTWPGSVQMFLFCFLATISGRLFDAGYYRPTLIFGLSFQLLGAFTTSFCKTYTQVFLAQGIAQGIGNGFVMCPTMSLVSTYFVKRRSVAVAWVASGTATGGVIFPLIAQQLLPKIGFGWTVRVMGFVMLANVAIILALGRTRIPGRESGPWLELGAFRETPYSLFICGMFCIFSALYFAFSYVNLYAKNVLGTSVETSLTILLLLNAIGLPGRVLPAILADRYFGPINTLIPAAFFLAIMFFVWIAIDNLPSLYVFVIIFGFVDATVQGIFTGSLTSLTKDLSKIGTRVGMVLSILAFAALGGPPIAGALVDMNGGDFLYTQIFGGVMTFVGVGFLVAARIAETGFVLKKRM